MPKALTLLLNFLTLIRQLAKEFKHFKKCERFKLENVLNYATMSVNNTQVKHIAQLANIPISEEESNKLAQDFSETLQVVDQLKKADVSQVEITHQITGFKNVLREDVVKEKQSFTQQEALANAKKTYQGYFVVPYVLHNKDN